MTPGDLTAIGQFVQDQGVLTVMILGFGLFFALRIFPWIKELSEQWIQIQKERGKQNDDRLEKWVTAIEQHTGAIRELVQLMQAQHSEVLRRLDALGARVE